MLLSLPELSNVALYIYIFLFFVFVFFSLSLSLTLSGFGFTLLSPWHCKEARVALAFGLRVHTSTDTCRSCESGNLKNLTNPKKNYIGRFWYRSEADHASINKYVQFFM